MTMSIFLVSNPIHKDVNTWTLARKEKDNSFPQGCLCLQQKSEELWQGDWNWIIRWWLSCKMFDWANNQLWLWLWPSLERFEHVQPSRSDPTTLSRRTYQSLAWKPKLSGSRYHFKRPFCKLSFFQAIWERWPEDDGSSVGLEREQVQSLLLSSMPPSSEYLSSSINHFGYPSLLKV